MSNAVNRAISSNSPAQVTDVLTNLLDTFKMERDDYAQIELAKAIALNKKAAFETALPERASEIGKKAIQGRPRKIKQTSQPSRELLDDFALIESPEVDVTEIASNMDVKSLQGWLKLKILGKEFPAVRRRMSKMRSEDLLRLVDDYKNNGLNFSEEAIEEYTPAKSAAKDISPVKSTRAVAKEKAAAASATVRIPMWPKRISRRWILTGKSKFSRA